MREGGESQTSYFHFSLDILYVTEVLFQTIVVKHIDDY
jgi:hypothetical protein